MDTFPRPFWWAAVERFTMGSDKCVHLIRRLLEPTVDHQARKHCNATVSVSTSNGRLGLGIPSDEEARQLVSSSFTQTLVEALPCHYAGGTAPFGNEWFWEGYRYGLFGENIIYDVDRAGIILSEDTLDEQKKFRLVANASLGIQISDSGVKPELGENSRALIHGSAKIDVLYSISLSVVLHVAQQPILEYEEGPQAVILCATKNECDEFTSVLNEFCSQLHLIVHNLFDPYPSIPTGKRADIVVGTPPLWDAVSPSLNVLGSAGGLEDLLDGLNKFSNPAWSSTTSRWRPYNLNSVAQLVIFDVELQVHSGYGGILKRILTVQSAAAPMLAHIAGLPLDCQFYVVRGGDRYTYSSMIIDVAHQTEEICRLVCSRGKQTGWETARLSVQLCEDSQLDADNRESELRAKQVLPSRKRCRSTSPQLENSHAERTVGRLHPQRSHGILIRNALSCSRLCVDASAYVELKEGVLEEAKRFWSSFDEVEHDKCMFELDIVAAKLAFLVFERSGADSPLDTAGRPPAELPLPHPEACLLIEPRKITDRLATRFELLFRHLEEKFNGEMFDGSIMSCLNLCDSQLDLTYILESTADLSIGELAKCSLMSYLTQLGITCGISPTDCRLQLSPYCVVLAYLERRDERESSLTLSASRDAVFDALRQKDCKEVVSQDNDKLVGLFSESLSTFETSIPLTTFLKSRTPSHPFTVVVLRNICCSSQELFMGEATPANPTAKPLALFLLEECCQYGRVVSYCCFEQAAKPSESSPGVLRIGQEGALGSTSRVGMRTASLFVEFESHFSAMEAVRLLRYRFEVDDDTVVGCRPRRVHLLRNALYYVGVAEIPQSTDDCDDLGMNLLAE